VNNENQYKYRIIKVARIYSNCTNTFTCYSRTIRPWQNYVFNSWQNFNHCKTHLQKQFMLTKEYCLWKDLDITTPGFPVL